MRLFSHGMFRAAQPQILLKPIRTRDPPLGQPRQTHADESHQGRLEEAKFLPLACHEDRLEEAKRLPRASVLSFLAFGEGLCDSPTRGRRFTCGGGGYA